MATVISNKKSTYGSPYAFYTLDLSYSNRTLNSVVVSYTLKVNLQYSNSNLGKGYPLTAIIYAGGSNSGEITLKPSSTSWSGTSVKTFTGSFTVTGLSASTSSISTALYSSAYYGGAYRACIRPAVSGSNLDIPTIAQRSISYSLNGGSGSFATQYKYDGYSISLHSGKPTRGNSTANGYTVTFNANGGTTSKTNQTATDTISYSFNNWYSSADGKYYSAGATYSYNADTTMTAQWSSSTSKGSITLPTASQCTRANYNLLGWSTSSSATSASYSPGATFTPSSSVTLYAVWELANDKSTFSLSGNTFRLGTSDLVTVNIQRIVATNRHKLVMNIYGETLTILDTDSTDTWISFNTTQSYGKYFPNSKTGTATLTLTTYTSGGTSLGSYSQTVTLEITGNSKDIPEKPVYTKSVETPTSTTVNLTIPTCKWGATFDHWEAETTIGEVIISGNTLTNTIDEFNNNSGIISIQAVDSRGYKSLPVYIHWHSRKRGFCLYEDNIYKSVTKYIYYNGSWVRVEDMLYDTKYNFTYGDIYTIGYDLDGGTLPSDAPILYKYNLKDITLPIPTKEGYDFGGWYESEDFSGDAITSISVGTIGSKTYYAKWIVPLPILTTGLQFNAAIPSNATEIIFTDKTIEEINASTPSTYADFAGGAVGVPEELELDISKAQNNSVILYNNGIDTKYYVTTQKAGQKIIANENCSYMFSGIKNSACRNLTSITGLEKVDVQNVANMSSMFDKAGFDAKTCNIDGMSDWNTSKVTNMSRMFDGTGYEAYTFDIGDISNWNVQNVTDMSNMFASIGYFSGFRTLDLSGWNTPSLLNLSQMFVACRLKTIYVGDGWNISNVTSSRNMFFDCTSLIGQSGTTYDSSKVDASMANWQTGYLTYRAKIPEGATYTLKSDGTTLTAGMPFPDTVTRGDIYTYGDYEYEYDGVGYGWRVGVLDNTKAEYGKILNSINNIPITDMMSTFSNCSNLTIAPTIPNTVIYMSGTFYGCTNLTTAPVIPNGVEDMFGTFEDCMRLVTVPVIPDSVLVMVSTFKMCESLTGEIEINANPDDCDRCFWGTWESIKIVGSTTLKAELAATSYSGNVTYEISFTISNVSYQAENDMTWGEWCNSDYNTGGFYVEPDHNYIYGIDSNGKLIEIMSVIASDKIIYDEYYVQWVEEGENNRGEPK